MLSHLKLEQSLHDVLNRASTIEKSRYAPSSVSGVIQSIKAGKDGVIELRTALANTFQDEDEKQGELLRTVEKIHKSLDDVEKFLTTNEHVYEKSHNKTLTSIVEDATTIMNGK